MGYAGFDFQSPHEVFREHAQLSTHANDGNRAFNIGAWSWISAEEYENWQPAAWPMTRTRESARGPMFVDGRFQHPDGRARFVPLTPRLPENALTQQFPLVLNTGRVRDHWHTMTRTGKSGKLSAHIAEPYAEINTADALRFAVRNGELAQLQSNFGSMVARVCTGTDVPSGMVFVPIHWNRAYASDARVGALTNPVVDPISGEPELKHTPVSIAPYAAEWYGVMLTRTSLPPPALDWWTRVQGEQFTRYELAGRESGDWARLARGLLGVADTDVDWME
jgi:assimilatory nitrate reductase catalytic subunit